MTLEAPIESAHVAPFLRRKAALQEDIEALQQDLDALKAKRKETPITRVSQFRTSSTSIQLSPSMTMPHPDTSGLAHTHNAAGIFFSRARSVELRDKARCMVRRDDRVWEPVSWGEMADRVACIAAFLIDRGLDRDAKSAVMSSTRVEWGLAGLGILAARGVLVPVYPGLAGESLGHILRHSDAQVLFVENAQQLEAVLQVWDELTIDTLVTIEALDAHGCACRAGLDAERVADKCFSLPQAEASGRDILRRQPALVEQRLASIRLEDVGLLVYTSGTTGMPKGVLLTHRNLGINGDDWIRVNGALLHPGDLDILWLPMSHIFGWGQFCLGNQLGFVTYFSNPAEALADMAELSPQIFMSVPAYWEKLARMAQSVADDEQLQWAELRRLTGGRLSFCLSGGAGLGLEVKELFRAAGIMIIEGYGLTECSPTLTMNRIDDYDFESVGKPFPRVRVKLAPDGEILAKGDNCFAGYYKDESATAAMFDADGWLKTGDLGSFNERGFLRIIGRKKEILVTAGGKNIPPQNIELRFRNDPLISQLVVYGDGKRYLTALVDIHEEAALELLEGAGEPDPSSVREHALIRRAIADRIASVNADLASFETIKAFAIASAPLTPESGLLTVSLKVRRASVYDAYRDVLEGLYSADNARST